MKAKIENGKLVVSDVQLRNTAKMSKTKKTFNLGFEKDYIPSVEVLMPDGKKVKRDIDISICVGFDNPDFDG